MTAKFNPSRLKLARTRRQLTFKALAEKVRLTPRMVSEYEKEYCTSVPPQATIEAFASALNYPETFFLDDDPIEEVSKDIVSFRSLKSMKAAQEHAAIGAGQLGVLINNFFEQRFTMLEPNLPDFRGVEPEIAAQALREEWGIGVSSIGNMIHLLEKNGVRVFSLAENTQDVDAFSFWKGGTPFVFLNTQKSAERSRFDAAHELAHLVLHKHGTPQGRDAEAEADRFASSLLMPRSTILPYKGRNITIESILRLKHNWRVSAFALIVQMKNTGVLSEWQYKSLVITASKLGLRTKEIDGIQREDSHVIKRIFEVWKQEGFTLVDFANVLSLPVDEISGLLFRHSVIVGNTDKRRVSISPNSQAPHLQLVK